jgi:hypothetical protein
VKSNSILEDRNSWHNLSSNYVDAAAPDSHYDNSEKLLMNNLHSLELAIIELRESKKATGRIQRFIPQREMKSSGLRIVGLTCG